MANTDHAILLGEVKGLVQRALDQHDHLVQKLETDAHHSAEALQTLRAFVEAEDEKLQRAHNDAARALEVLRQTLDTLQRQAITQDHLGRAGLTAWQIFFGAIWSLALLVGAHLWK